MFVHRFEYVYTLFFISIKHNKVISGEMGLIETQVWTEINWARLFNSLIS